MTPDELVAMTEKIGDYEGIPFKMTRPTILRYEKTKLIPEPKRGGHGRGVGRWTDYPAGTVEQIYAAWCLIHGHYGGPAEFFFSKTQLPEIPPESVRSLRKGYLLGIVDPSSDSTGAGKSIRLSYSARMGIHVSIQSSDKGMPIHHEGNRTGSKIEI